MEYKKTKCMQWDGVWDLYADFIECTQALQKIQATQDRKMFHITNFVLQSLLFSPKFR